MHKILEQVHEKVEYEGTATHCVSMSIFSVKKVHKILITHFCCPLMLLLLARTHLVVRLKSIWIEWLETDYLHCNILLEVSLIDCNKCSFLFFFCPTTAAYVTAYIHDCTCCITDNNDFLTLSFKWTTMKIDWQAITQK